MPNIERHAYQALFVELSKRSRFAAFFSGLQSGKSVAGADASVELLYYKNIELPPQTRGGLNPEFWILSRSFTLADQAWDYFKWRAELITGNNVVYSDAECKKMGLTRQDGRTHWLKPLNRPDGRPIRCRVRTAHDPEQMRATGVLLLAWCDESAHWRQLAWQNLRGRGIVTPTIYLVTTTPKGKNWCYRELWLPGAVYKASYNADGGVTGRITEDGDRDISVVSCSSFDNPWADADYLKNLRKTMGKEYAQQEIDGLFTEAVGLVYSYDTDKHKKRPKVGNWEVEGDYGSPEDYERIVIGCDPGYGSPYAMVVLGKDFDGVWWVLDEWKKSKATPEDVRKQVTKWYSRWGNPDIFVDKRRPTDRNILLEAGFKAFANRELYTEKSMKTLMPMVRYVQSLIRTDRFFVTPLCEETETEMENYRFPDRSEAKEPKSPGENPIKHMDDLLDAVRYGICSVDHYIDLGTLHHEPDERSGELKPVKKKDRNRTNIYIPTREEYLAFQDAEYDRLLKEEKQWHPSQD